MVSSFFQLPDALFSRGREKEGGLGVSLCKANSLLQPTQCPYRPVPGHRSSPITSTAPRESHNREEAELLTSVAEVTAVPCVSIPEATASLSRPGVQGPLLFIQAAARVRQPTVEYHLLALQAASTRYSCMRQGNCVKPARSQ